MNDMVKVSMNLPMSEAAVVAEMAQDRHITKTDVVRRAIALEQFVEDVLAKNGKILIEREDGTVERVLLPWRP